MHSVTVALHHIPRRSRIVGIYGTAPRNRRSTMQLQKCLTKREEVYWKNC
jgi:hypothetical protein